MPTQFSIIKSRPIIHWIFIALLNVVLTTACWLLLDQRSDLLINLSFNNRLDDIQQTSNNLEQNNQSLQTEVVKLNKIITMNENMISTLETDFIRQQEAEYKLKAELEFYKDILLSPTSKGLNINGIHIANMTRKNHYHYKLILTYVTTGGKLTKAKFTMKLEGIQEGKVVQYDAKKLSASKLEDNFEIKNFKRITGVLVLPEEFEATRVIVSLSQNGKTILKKEFEWQSNY